MTTRNHSQPQPAAKVPLELIVRAGYAANGVMYVAVGILARYRDLNL